MDISKINELLDELCQKVGGKWLLTGGSLIQLEADAERATEDIDLVGIEHESLSDVAAQDEMFKAAVRIGLSPENVNSAASYFVHRLPGWKNHLVPLRSGARGEVYRPNLNLFIALKLGRETEIDLADIESAIRAYGKAEFQFSGFEKLADAKTLARFEKHRARWGV